MATAAKRSPGVVATWMGPNRVEPWKWPNPARKVRLQIEEDLGRKVTGSKFGASNNFLQWNLCYNVPFLLWFAYAKSIHVWYALADCLFALMWEMWYELNKSNIHQYGGNLLFKKT